MKLSNFTYELPEKLLAEYPSDQRDESRLMVLHRDSNKIEHKLFKDVIDYFDDGDSFILNNTKVFPARLMGNKEKTGAKIEVFLLRELSTDQRLWDVLVDPARKIRIGNKLYFGDDDSLVAEVIDNTTSRGRTLRFLYDGSYEEFRDKLIKGVNLGELTLHVGLGTFNPVEVEDLSKHKMDSEELFINDDLVNMVNKTKLNKNKVCAVGTTVMRGLESSVSSMGTLNTYQGWTHKFIFPPYNFSIADSLITNFHMPKSTLLMMVAAFGGYDFMMEAYQVAIKEKYRFYSYGDAMLIL